MQIQADEGRSLWEAGQTRPSGTRFARDLEQRKEWANNARSAHFKVGPLFRPHRTMRNYFNGSCSSAARYKTTKIGSNKRHEQ